MENVNRNASKFMNNERSRYEEEEPVIAEETAEEEETAPQEEAGEEPQAENTEESHDEHEDGWGDSHIHIDENSIINHFSYQLIKSLSIASESYESAFKGHARRTAEYAKELAKRMGMNDDQQIRIYCAALIHDIGNIAVKSEIFASKNDKLTKDEYNSVMSHTTAGAKILKGITEVPELLEAAKWHHEKWDGTGYPDKLSGSDIPLSARIVAVAEAYDAMTSDRPYRNALPQSMVREEFVKGLGKQFDPEICKIMLAMINEDKKYEHRQVAASEWKILIVDDDPMILKMGEYILSRHKQYSVTTANSGKAALKLLKDNPDFDLILLDVEMPLLNGVETLIRIRNDESISNIPVIFVTADNSKETLTTALKFTISGYITKPFAPHFFLKKINEVLNSIEKKDEEE